MFHSVSTLYLAAPIDEYYTDHYERALAAVRAAYPDTHIIEPREQNWHSASQWRTAFDALITTLDLLLFVTRDDGSIGQGVAVEIYDCQKRNIPVIGYSPEGFFVAQYKLHYIAGGSYIAWARVEFDLSMALETEV